MVTKEIMDPHKIRIAAFDSTELKGDLLFDSAFTEDDCVDIFHMKRMYQKIKDFENIPDKYKLNA